MRKKFYLPAVAAAAIAVFASVAVVSAKSDSGADNTIADRVYIGEIHVGGMTQEEATEAVSEYVDSLEDKEITLKAGDRSITATAEELGLEWSDTDVAQIALDYGKTGNLIARYKANKDLEHEDKVFPVILKTNEEKATAFLEEETDDLEQKAQDYGLKRENGAFTVVAGKSGTAVDVENSIKAINEAFSDGWKDNMVVELATKEEKPKGSQEELAKVKDVLGTFHTSFSSSTAGRVTNIENACGKINGTVLYPGEEFSVYEAISPMDAENGYALAGSYENGTTVQSYGGGVCQVSTTLYNAVIRAELEITERYAHSMIVSYVDPSSDAAIAGTYKDLKFKNNTDAPIYIEGYTSGRTLYFTIYGQETRDPGREVSFESETTGTTQPKTEIRATNAKIGSITKVQSSHTGRTARLWKIVTVNGVEQSREVFNNSTYRASPAIYEVGTASSNKEAVAAMKEAIATGNIDTVKAAASKWANADKEKEKQEQEEENKKEETKQKDTDKQQTSDKQETDSGKKEQGASDSSQKQEQTDKEDSGNSKSEE
ncbi:MAG TPA: VanW family protein [Candidatus Eubacterium avistercoris]|uniref:VanW family protein n=1 Tax=Candidatus Eubacterium avistercoris TaxID=2838567 RepID=A0A9D2D5A0_9FIRM|nr:VanW family protein [Candidatus Eubacterium avistercoris]